MSNSFDYAVLRVVPRTEREEFFNAGIVLYCARQRFLGARAAVDEQKWQALASERPIEEVERRLEAVLRICAGDPSAGPIAALSESARFHWITAPRSTLIQPSAVHSGICEDAHEELERLFREQVLERAHMK